MRTHFDAVELNELVESSRDKQTLLIAALNYEDRSVGFIQWFLGECNSQLIDPSRIFVQLLWPKGSLNNVELLEQLKTLNFKRLSKLLEKYNNNRFVFTYPNDFNDRQVIDCVIRSPVCHSGKPYNLVVDISCMPRRVIVSVCDAIQQIVRSKDLAQWASIFFIYVSPAKYASPRYAENVGEVRGYFSGRPLHDCLSDNVSTIIFPSLQGYEGKLLYDEICTHIDGEVIAFVAISTHDFHTSLSTMRANQFLMEHMNVEVLYYFSLKDGMDKLADQIDAETKKVTNLGERPGTVLVAPFGPKIFTVAAYFLLKNLPAASQNLKTEIAHVSGFQYLSLYSLGFGHSSGFKLSFEE